MKQIIEEGADLSKPPSSAPPARTAPPGPRKIQDQAEHTPVRHGDLFPCIWCGVPVRTAPDITPGSWAQEGRYVFVHADTSNRKCKSRHNKRAEPRRGLFPNEAEFRAARTARGERTLIVTPHINREARRSREKKRGVGTTRRAARRDPSRR